MPRWKCMKLPSPNTTTSRSRHWTSAARRPASIFAKWWNSASTPRINTGIAHKEAGVGQVGAGLVRPPKAIFEEALIAYAERYNL